MRVTLPPFPCAGRRALAAAVFVALSLIALPSAAYPGAPWFQPGRPYTENFPDPSIVRVGGTYYAYGTSTGGTYLPVMSSTDLVTWIARPAYDPGPPLNSDPFFNDALPYPASWAPDRPVGGRLKKEVRGPGAAQIGGRFVVFYSIRESLSSERFCISVATSGSALGPFDDSSPGPFMCDSDPNGSIDPQPFVDPADNTPYLIWKSEGVPGSQPTKIWARQLSGDGLSFAPGSQAHVLVQTSQGWEGNLIENAAMVRHQGKLYLFYSANEWPSAAYAIGYAECVSMVGPCTKWPNNPVLGSRGDRLGPGAPAPFVDAGGRLQLAYHYWNAPFTNYPPFPQCQQDNSCTTQGQRRMAIEPVYVVGGHLQVGGIVAPACTSRPATPASRAFLAEGSTDGGFETWVLVANPRADRAARACLTFLTSSGPVAGPLLDLAAQTRASIRVSDWVRSFDVSTVVEGVDSAVYTERAVYSSTPGKGGAHVGKGAPAAGPSWVLAEGATAGGFETWVLVANPDPTQTVNVKLTYLTGSGPVAGPTFSLAPSSRRTVRVDDTVDTFDVSTLVTASGNGVVAERATYLSGARSGATDSPGATAGATSWFLTEGATAGEFETWVLVANPELTQSADVRITYLTGSGPVAGPSFTVPPSSRRTVRVDDTVDTFDVSTQVQASRPVVAERAVYTASGRLGNGAATGEGVSTTGTDWLLVEGATAGGFESWVLVANPDPVQDAVVQLTYLTSTGPVTGPTFTLPPASRRSVRVNDAVSVYDVSTRVRTTRGSVVVERSVYSPAGLSQDVTTGPAIKLS